MMKQYWDDEIANVSRYRMGDVRLWRPPKYILDCKRVQWTHMIIAR